MKKTKKVLSLTLSSALMLTSAPWPAAAVGPVAEMPAFAQAFAPAESLGYVASSYAHTKDVTRPRLIVIADLHGHVEVQRHIVDMLDGLVNKLTTGPQAQKQVQIFVEGAWQSHLEHPLATVKNPKVRSLLADYFLRKSEIPASQAFSERFPNATNFTLTGVENEHEYEANRARFVQSYPARKRLLSAIARHEYELKVLSGSVETRAYEKLQSMRQGYLSGSLSADRYARALAHQAGRFSIQDRYVDILNSPNAATHPEFDLALAEVGREISAKLAESRPLTAIFRGDEKIVRKNLASVDTYLDLLKRTLSDQLTPEEVPYAYARIPQMTQVAKAIISTESLNIDVADTLGQALAFYPLAFMRNDSLIQNSLAALQKMAPTDTGILIVGGFHSEAIGQYLQAQQIPYLLINPIVSRDLSTVEQLNYVERMAGDHVTADEVRADFAHSFGHTADSANSSSGEILSNINTEPPSGPAAAKVAAAGEAGVTGAAEVNPKLANEIGQPPSTPPTPSDKDKKGSKGESSMGENSPYYAGLAAAEELGLEVVNKTNGLSLVDGAERTEASDIAMQVVQEVGSPIEHQIDPKNITTFRRNDAGVYSATGDPSNELSLELATVLHTIPEGDQPENMPDIIMVGVHGPVHGAYALSNGKTETATVSHDDDFITVGVGGEKKNVVVFYNMDAKDKTARQHELVHAVTGKRFRGERAVQTQAVKAYFQAAAEEALNVGLQHVATAGLFATSIPTKVVLSKLWGIRSEIPVSFFGLMRLGTQIFSSSQNGSVSLNGLFQLLDNALHPDAAQQLADAQVERMKAKLITQFPGLTDYEAGKVAMDVRTPAYAVGFAYGNDQNMWKRAAAAAAKITQGAGRYITRIQA